MTAAWTPAGGQPHASQPPGRTSPPAGYTLPEGPSARVYVWPSLHRPDPMLLLGLAHSGLAHCPGGRAWPLG